MFGDGNADIRERCGDELPALTENTQTRRAWGKGSEKGNVLALTAPTLVLHNVLRKSIFPVGRSTRPNMQMRTLCLWLLIGGEGRGVTGYVNRTRRFEEERKSRQKKVTGIFRKWRRRKGRGQSVKGWEGGGGTNQEPVGAA